jgi:DNA processing protein
MSSLSTNTQVALLLTAPLLDGASESSTDLFTPSEYRKLCALLKKANLQPSCVLDSADLPTEVRTVVDDSRLKNLLGRGFQLSQAIERWQSRAIWVVGHLDENYPVKLKQHLNEQSPAIIYGCGEAGLLNQGGLAVVGSRSVDDWLIEYTQNVGRTAALAQKSIVSGGARGIDQAAMRGALEAGGCVIGILSDGLERAVIAREHRNLIIDGKLTLISPYDPAAGFNIGHAMQRNRLIYALSDFALVVNSDFEKGGTWAGAVEQLEKFHFVPIYVRSTGDLGKGLEMLAQRGARSWPNPTTPEEFNEVMTTSGEVVTYSEQLSLL